MCLGCAYLRGGVGSRVLVDRPIPPGGGVRGSTLMDQFHEQHLSFQSQQAIMREVAQVRAVGAVQRATPERVGAVIAQFERTH